MSLNPTGTRRGDPDDLALAAEPLATAPSAVLDPAPMPTLYEQRAAEPGVGRGARSPLEIPFRAWLSIFRRVGLHMLEDSAGLAASGVAFYLVLAIFPAVAAFVALYGLIADPAIIANHLDRIGVILPSAALELLTSELERILASSDETLGIAFFGSLAFSLWSANNSVRALFSAMNVAYREVETRSFLRLLLVSFTITICGMVFGFLVLNIIVTLSVIAGFLGMRTVFNQLISLVPPLAMFVMFTTAVAFLYRWGPSRRRAKWRWVLPGASVAALAWVLMSTGFAFFLANFANYNATYGSLAAAVALMMWFFLSAYIVIIGATLNAEMERQTATDTTRGPDRPLGERGAQVADTVSP